MNASLIRWLSALMILFGSPSSLAVAAELVMVERSGCPYCARWNRDVAPIYEKTPEGHLAPLRRLDLADVKASTIAFSEPVRFTPTFILVDDNKEVGRLTGYMNDDMFWGLLDGLLKKASTSQIHASIVSMPASAPSEAK